MQLCFDFGNLRSIIIIFFILVETEICWFDRECQCQYGFRCDRIRVTWLPTEADLRESRKMQLRPRKKPKQEQSAESVDIPNIEAHVSSTSRKKSTSKNGGARIRIKCTLSAPTPRIAVPELPIEVWERVAEYLDDNPWSLNRLAAVNQQLRGAIGSHRVWQRISQQMGLSLPPDATQNEPATGPGKKRKRHAKFPMNHHQLVVKQLGHCCARCLKCLGKGDLQAATNWAAPGARANSLCVGKCFPSEWRAYYQHRAQQDEQQRKASAADHKITKSKGCGEYHVPYFAMDYIPHVNCPNPHYKSAAPMCLYVRWDVECMRDFLYGSAQGLTDYLAEKERQKQANQDASNQRKLHRKQKVEAELENMRYDTTTLLEFEPLEIYVEKGHGKLMDVVNRYADMLDRRQEVIEYCIQKQGSVSEDVWTVNQVTKYIHHFKEGMSFYTLVKPALDRRFKRIERTQEFNNIVAESGYQFSSGSADALCQQYLESYEETYAPFGLKFLLRRLELMDAEKEQRRHLLEERLNNLESFENLQCFRDYVQFGTRSANQMAALLARHCHDPDKLSENQRKERLRACLKSLGVELRSDSHLCNAFIHHHSGDLVDVVDIMVSMNWFFKHTTYASDRFRHVSDHDYYSDSDGYDSDGYDSDDYRSDYYDHGFRRYGYMRSKRTVVNSDMGKRIALAKWMKTLFDMHQYDYPSTMSAEKRPPPCVRPYADQMILMQLKVGVDTIVKLVHSEQKSDELNTVMFLALLDQMFPRMSTTVRRRLYLTDDDLQSKDAWRAISMCLNYLCKMVYPSY